MMDIEHALLRTIHDNPWDDTNWLVLADWLEESDQPLRARFLRQHLALRDMDEGKQRKTLEEEVLGLLLAGVRPCVPTLVNSIGMELTLIPAGSFWLGSPENEEGRYADESPRRCIHISQPFYLGTYAVTQQEYQQVMGRNPSAHAAEGRRGDAVVGMNTRRFPVEEVTWNDAAAFCAALSNLPGERERGRVYRLPTEAEREYACRGGASLMFSFPWGKKISNEMCNYKDLSRRKNKRRNLDRPCEVGSYPPNGFGLYDVVGNVWEWCQDWYSSDAYMRNPPTDPPGPADGDRRNARGGPFHLSTRRVRSADRSSFEPEYHDGDCGFRVLCPWRADML